MPDHYSDGNLSETMNVININNTLRLIVKTGNYYVIFCIRCIDN